MHNCKPMQWGEQVGELVVTLIEVKTHPSRNHDTLCKLHKSNNYVLGSRRKMLPWVGRDGKQEGAHINGTNKDQSV
jgi:hypothetical protein